MKIFITIFTLSTLGMIIKVIGVDKVNSNQTLKRHKRLAIHGNNGDANFDEFRFTVSVEDWNEYFQGRFCGYGSHCCGGSILTPKFVLTAAHCVERQWFQLPRKMKVRAGSPKKGDGGSLHDVIRYIEHKNYWMRPQGFDIALLELKTDIDVTNSHARVIEMVDNNFALHPSVEVKTAGWGRLHDDTFPKNLQSLEFKIIGTEECNGLYNEKAIHAVTGEFCAHSDRGQVMDGDSGGPLIIRVDDKYKLAGIVVRGKDGLPGIFTDVSHFREWIDERIEQKN